MSSLVDLQKMSTAGGHQQNLQPPNHHLLQATKLSQTYRGQKSSKTASSKKKEASLSTMKTGGIKPGSSL